MQSVGLQPPGCLRKQKGQQQEQVCAIERGKGGIVHIVHVWRSVSSVNVKATTATKNSIPPFALLQLLQQLFQSLLLIILGVQTATQRGCTGRGIKSQSQAGNSALITPTNYYLITSHWSQALFPSLTLLTPIGRSVAPDASMLH